MVCSCHRPLRPNLRSVACTQPTCTPRFVKSLPCRTDIVGLRSVSRLTPVVYVQQWIQPQVPLEYGKLATKSTHVRIVFGPILWGHRGPLCHALSLSSSWTSMRRRRATVAAVATPGEWQCKTARSSEWAQHFSNASRFYSVGLTAWERRIHWQRLSRPSSRPPENRWRELRRRQVRWTVDKSPSRTATGSRRCGRAGEDSPLHHYSRQAHRLKYSI